MFVEMKGKQYYRPRKNLEKRGLLGSDGRTTKLEKEQLIELYYRE